MTILAAAMLLLPLVGDEEAEPREGQSAALAVNREHQETLKACIAPILKRRLPQESARIQVILTVEAGAVSAISVNAPKELSSVASCLEKRARHWSFPVREESHSVEVPIVLQGSGP